MPGAAEAVTDAVRSLDWPGAPALALAEPDVRAAVARLGEGPTRWVAGAVARSVAELADDAGDSMAPWDDIRALLHGLVVDCLLRLVDGRDPPGAADMVVHRALVDDIVVRGLDLSRITAAMRTEQHVLLAAFVEHALTRSDGAAAIPEVVRVLTTTVDHWVATFTDTAMREREHALESSHARRRTTVERLVDGAVVDVASASALLDVPLAGWHVGCVVGAGPGGAVQTADVHRVATSFARAARTGATVRYDSSAGQVWLWVCGEHEPRLPPPAELTVPPPLRVGIGGAHRGVDGLRRTHLEAVDALRLVGGSQARVLAYGDVSLAALLSQDEERARWFVEHELRELAGPGEDDATLRDTLRAFFTTRMRVAPAAELLFLHRNSLINRLERVERLLGHGVAERTAEVQAALLLRELYPPSDRA